MKKSDFVSVLLLIILLIFLPGFSESQSVDIIPKPVEMKVIDGYFSVTKKTCIEFDEKNPEISKIVNYFQTGFLKIAGISFHEKSSKKKIVFQLIENTSAGNEGYKLKISKDLISLTASNPAGLFYGVQTLLQLIPGGSFGKHLKSIKLPFVEITDHPRFKWRGTMLDVSRHFYDKEFVKKFIDCLAFHKMNIFHWHLVDGTGWRIEIKKYPLLTEKAAWREDVRDEIWNPVNMQAPKEGAGEPYGGFYTQEDIQEIVQYAAERYITIVPEIEMPGHSNAALYAYPELICENAGEVNDAFQNSGVFCAGKEKTFEFLENILDEVIQLFPGEYIHIGGDEVPKNFWQNCPACQKRMENENLKNEEELQSYFIHRIQKYLASKDKKLIGWDEILEGGLPENATVMSWRGLGGGIEAAKQGNDAIMSPTSYCYFDYYQSLSGLEPTAFGGFIPLSLVYEFEPVPDTLSSEQAKHILGCQANLWTEYVQTPEHAEYMFFPRMAALSEVAWTPRDKRNWEDFKNRMPAQFKRYDFFGINYAKSAYIVSGAPVLDSESQNLQIQLSTELGDSEIRYTLDGSEPTSRSKRFAKPVDITQTCTLKAASFQNNKQLGPVYKDEFIFHKAIKKKVELKYPVFPKYAGRGEFNLVDGITGSLFHTDSDWYGFEETDFEAVIDLEKEIPVEKISIGFLQQNKSWIFLPYYVQFFISNNGKKFEEVTTVMSKLPSTEGEPKIERFSCSLLNKTARYVKIYAKSIGRCPEWHPGAGGKSWLFTDEIVVE